MKTRIGALPPGVGVKLFAFLLLISTSALSQSRSHVYRPNRLVVIDSTVTVTGVVYYKKKEKDGDLHINIRVGSQYSKMLNARNIAKQKGCLVAEIVCAGKITQPDAQQACDNYDNTIPLPKVGDEITVTGPFVNDGDHGWNEIHPVISLRITK